MSDQLFTSQPLDLYLLYTEQWKSVFFLCFNPLDPNPAISAHAVFPQSGHIRPEKRPFFHNFPYFFQFRTSNKILTAHRGPTYQIKASKIPCKTQKKLFCFYKYMCVGKTLNMDSCSKFWGNLEGIWENPGEIPHIGCKIPRVYRVNKDILYIMTHDWSGYWIVLDLFEIKPNTCIFYRAYYQNTYL